MALLDGKTILVAGAGRGIGLAAAIAAHREGAELVLVDSGVNVAGEDPDPRVVTDAAALIQADGGEPLFFEADCCDAAQLSEVLGHAKDHFGKLDGAVWSVGLSRVGQLSRATDERVANLVGREIGGAFQFMRATMDIFGTSGGRIVVLGGADAFLGGARRSMAAAVDGALVGMVRSAAVEVARRSVMVNAVIPTARTRLTADLPLFQSAGENSMTPEHICPVILHLLSDAAEGTTGEVIGIAGGRAYGFRTRETPGVFAETGTFGFEEIAQRWEDLIRGA